MSADLGTLLQAAGELHRGSGYSPIETTAGLARDLDPGSILEGHPLLETVHRLPPSGSLPIPAEHAAPDLLGQVYEQLLDWEQRRETGSHFTPPNLASRLVALATDRWTPEGPITVCDPAVGSGVFLLAAARALEQRGLSRSEIVQSRLFGSDVSGEALVVADAALALWAGGTRPGDHLTQGDSVSERLWDGPFTLVVGNPPFFSQLASSTARSRAEAAALQERFGEAALGYVDSAALFLLASLELVASPGRLLMVQPQSTLAATHAETVRRAVQGLGDLRAAWLGGRQSFAAEVEVCALLVEVDGVEPPGPISVFVGADFEPAASHDPESLAASPTWSVLLASAGGVPSVELTETRTLGELCTATAGFRDQFYGLAEYTQEFDEQRAGPALPWLTTVGMIDPARSRWGTASFRFNRERWIRPVLDIESLVKADPTLGAWASSRLVPKVCVATQTRVIEVAVDSEGTWVPATPVIAVHADRGDLWLVAAALMAPPVSVWAMRNHAGAALSSDALRLSARQILSVPLPTDRAAWESGARCVEDAAAASRRADPLGWRAHMEELGERMCIAYGISDQGVLLWWKERLPPWR